MSKSKFPIQVTSSGIIQEDVLMIGESTIKQWKIPTHQYLMLHFGSFRQHVKVIPVPKYDGIRIHPALARKTGLFSGVQLRLNYKSGVLKMGPLISVLISRDYSEDSDKPFGTITSFCKELVDACRVQGAFVYFFTPDHIGSSTCQLQGWVYNGRWQKSILPIGDVINNRLTSRKFENKPSVQHFLKEVKSRYKTPFFNEKFLDKSEVFEALRKDTSLQRFLPESHMLRNFAGLKSMCAKYSHVFLKPIRGSLGKGIIRVSKQNGGIAYQAHYATMNGTRRATYPSLPKLFSSLSVKMKTTRYQMQQGLNLIENTKRPIDFRALVQKNATGKWNVTSIVARTAGDHHFVSNLARGGTLSTVKEAVSKSNLPPGNKGDAHLRLHKAALEIAKGVDDFIPAHFGELGIDLALDTSGHIWLLEVNSKPSKNDNTPLKENKIRPSVKQMIEYSRFLSGF
ncbi:YheC/YheD family protein [Paenibacillus terrigena]|uniref:YheC/YheD family endospore coat-associated protein n=1 Tax=Paenibacillus terrigena TaxID=369333 RepID=UPI00036EDA76|nr:YheC/YheD family protein [Paenibacillus terrigena]